MLSNVLQCSPTVSWLWSDRIVLLLGSGRKTWRWRHLWRKSELWKTSLKTMWGRGEKPSSCRIWRWEGGPCGFICYQDRDIEYPPCDTEHAHLRTKVALSSLYSQDLWILWIGSLHWLIEGALCFFQGIIYNLEKVLCHLMSRISLIRFCFQSRIVNILTGLRSNLKANWMTF